jgi:hypothetical protein
MRNPAGRINTCGRQCPAIRIVIELEMTTMGPTLKQRIRLAPNTLSAKLLLRFPSETT